MSDETDDAAKPELTHEITNYGATIRHSFQGERAVVTFHDGRTEEFTEDLGMIAQGAPNALLLALHAAKRDKSKRDEAASQERAAKRAAALVAKAGDRPTPTPPVGEPNPPEPFVADSPLPKDKPKRGNK